MGRNEEERGTMVLPSAALAPLRKALVTALNAEQDRIFELAKAVHDRLQQPDPTTGRKETLNAIKAELRKDDWQWWNRAHGLLSDIIDKIDGPIQEENGWSLRVPTHRWAQAERDAAMELLIPYRQKPQDRKVLTPLKKNLHKLPADTLHFSTRSETTLTIHPATRTVEWEVSRGKNNVRDAHKTTLAKAFFSFLENVKWTRGTGGVFRQSDEYAEDAAMSHGFNPVTISQHFGPLGEEEFTGVHGYNPRTRKVAKPYR
jgi:hypothetical protein